VLEDLVMIETPLALKGAPAMQWIRNEFAALDAGSQATVRVLPGGSGLNVPVE